MGQATSTLLETSGGEHERSTHPVSQGSDPEREILALLRRPARETLSLQEIRNELLPRFTELEIQTALLKLLESGAVGFATFSEFAQRFALGPKVSAVSSP